MVPACASHSARGRDALRSNRSSLTEADVQLVGRLLGVADMRRADTVAIDRALASSSRYVRALGVRTVGQNTITARAAHVRALVTDPDSAIAADAAFALGLLHDSTATATLATALSGPPTVAASAAWSLGELADRGRPALEAALRSAQPASSLADVLQASAKLRPVPATLILPYLTHANVEVRRAAVYAVTRSRVPSATRALVRLADSLAANPGAPGSGTSEVEVDLRSYLARGLTRQAAGDSLETAAVAILRRLVDDPHPHVRINAIRALATFGAQARAELVRHAWDTDPNTRITVAQSLGGVLDTVSSNWTNVWAADSGYTFRRSLLSTAMRVGVRLDAIRPGNLAAWQHSSDWRYRLAAAEAASAGTANDIDAIAVPLLTDPDGRVRNAAFVAASVFADSTFAAGKPYSRPSLRQSLDDADAIVRSSILDALRPRAREADAKVALRAWRRARNDKDNDARLAALRVIVSAWNSDSASFGSLRDTLASIAPPVDPLERAIGRAITPFRTWPTTGVTPRPDAWYVDQVRAFIARDLGGRPPVATINTTRGVIRVRCFASDAPLTVANFVGLARRGYYNGFVFHRVVPNFVAQDGDPRGDGSGGPGYAIRDELNRRWYDRGAVGMALSGPDTGGSQYFLAHSPQPHLDGHYTVFAQVTAGFDVLDSVVQGDRIVSIAIQ
jgi:cyclophilin family peptidyl-prolyl cis-trans isomerase/HEAT repeat protein